MSARRIEITDDLLHCIRYRHGMRPDGTTPTRRKIESVYASEVTLRCAFCGSYRTDWYNGLGQLEAQTYDLTPAYRAALDLVRHGRLDRHTDITLEVLRRLRSGPTPTRRLRAVS